MSGGHVLWAIYCNINTPEVVGWLSQQAKVTQTV